MYVQYDGTVLVRYSMGVCTDVTFPPEYSASIGRSGKTYAYITTWLPLIGETARPGVKQTIICLN